MWDFPFAFPFCGLACFLLVSCSSIVEKLCLWGGVFFFFIFFWGVGGRVYTVLIIKLNVISFPPPTPLPPLSPFVCVSFASISWKIYIFHLILCLTYSFIIRDVAIYILMVFIVSSCNHGVLLYVGYILSWFCNSEMHWLCRLSSSAAISIDREGHREITWITFRSTLKGGPFLFHLK